jgi:hypothetical protein
MGMTFSNVKIHVDGCYTTLVTCDTSSAAGTFYPGFKPSAIDVYDTVNNKTWAWCEVLSNNSTFQWTTSTQSALTVNAISVTAPDDASPARWAVTLGTNFHTNSSTLAVVCHR